MAVRDMHEMFMHELGDVYDAEHRVLEDREQRVESASSETLKDGIRDSLDRSRGRIQNIEQAFEKLSHTPERQTCDASQGLVSEAQRGIGEAHNGAVRDCLINAATIKEEMYKIAAYRNLIASARYLEQDNGAPLEGREEVADLLEENLRGTEETARTAEQSVGELLDVAKKAGMFQKAREAHEGQPQEDDKGLMDKVKDRFSGQ